MEVFFNRERPGYEEIVSYGPRWWTEYREMDAVYRFAGWTLDLMAYWLERLVNNQFPATADERAIEMFEGVLGIEPEPGATLEERRRTVGAYYSGNSKLSESVIKQLIKSYTGCDSDLWWVGLVLHIRIYCDEDDSFSNSKLFRILKDRIPAHIDFMVRNVLCRFELTERIEVVNTTYTMPFVWWGNTLDGRYALDGSVLLDAEFPPYFTPHYIVSVANGLKTEFGASGGYSMRIDNGLSDEMAVRYHVPFLWWTDYRTLDGRELLNGSKDLDQELPPFFRERHSAKIENAEEVSFFMYVPGESHPLDGSILLDGSINLSDGKEEL